MSDDPTGDNRPRDIVVLVVIIAGLAMIAVSVIGLLYVASSITTR